MTVAPVSSVFGGARSGFQLPHPPADEHAPDVLLLGGKREFGRGQKAKHQFSEHLPVALDGS